MIHSNKFSADRLVSRISSTKFMIATPTFDYGRLFFAFIYFLSHTGWGPVVTAINRPTLGLNMNDAVCGVTPTDYAEAIAALRLHRRNNVSIVFADSGQKHRPLLRQDVSLELRRIGHEFDSSSSD